MESETVRWWAMWVAGPDSGECVPLPCGLHLVGRSQTATVHCEDRQLEPLHLQLDVDDEEGLVVLQIGGRRPVTVDGVMAEGLVELEPRNEGHTIDVGASRLLLRCRAPRRVRPATLDRPVGDRRPLVRAGRVVPTWSPSAIPLPAAVPSHRVGGGSLVPALVGLAGAGAVAAVLDQPMFLLFGAIGALVGVASWAAQRAGGLRERRRSRRAAAAATDDFASALAEQRVARIRHHNAVAAGSVEAVAIASALDARVWSRRHNHPDAFTVSLGIGDVTWEPVLAGELGRIPEVCWTILERAAVIHDLSVPATLGPGSRIALSGPYAAAVGRAVLAQLAVQAGPADWRLLVVSGNPSGWESWRPLPHASSASSPAISDEQGLAEQLRDVREEPAAGADRARHTVVVVDDVRLLAARTSPVRRYLAVDESAALLVVTDHPGSVPALCTSLLVTGHDGRGSWTADTTTGELPAPLRIAGLGVAAAEGVIAALAQLTDPEDPASGADSIAASVALESLLDAADAADAVEIARRWVEASADAPPEAPLGVAADGVVLVDLVRDGPHALIGGTTGAGKSELLRTLVVGLAARLSPEQISFVLVDYKGGAAFDACAPLPHVAGVVTDLDGRLTARVLRSLRAELTRREQILREHDVTDLAGLRAHTGRPVMPRLVVVVDEFAAMAVEHAELLTALIGIAQRGRSLGVHLVLATQRPSGVISDDIRANTNLRLALRCADASDAMDVVGDPSPAALPRHRPGRTVMRLGPDELITFQTAHSDGALVERIVEAARLIGAAAAPRPWCDPLPALLPPDAVPGALGLSDLPDTQSQRPWTWSPADGNVVVAGASGSGVTSTLLAAVLTAATAAADAHEGVEVFVVDARGDHRWAELADHPRCAGVVRLHERERLWRMLRRLADAPATPAARLLVVDGVAMLRLELEALELTELRIAFERIQTDPSLAVTMLIGTDSPASVPATIVSRCAQRWVHFLHEPHDARALGVSAADVPHVLVPGRIALAVGRDVVEAQVAVTDPGAARQGVAVAGDLVRVEVLSSCVAADDLSRPRRVEGGLRLPVGIRADTLADAEIDVADGEHVLVIGPGRSGRSTTLALILDAWRDAHPAGWTGVATPRRSPLSSFARARPLDLAALPIVGPTLVLVDDAELVDDPTGALARLVACRRPGLLVVAAGRAESLRQLYGHWTAGVRKSRLGIVMAGASEMDADLLGVTLPRWSPIAARPGLGHLVADGTATLIQCALGQSAAVGAGTRSLAAVS